MTSQFPTPQTKRTRYLLTSVGFVALVCVCLLVVAGLALMIGGGFHLGDFTN